MKIDSTTKPIRQWPIFTATVVIALAIALAGYLYYSLEAASLHETNQREIQTVAELKVRQLTQWHKEKMGDARVISRSPFFIQAIEKWLAHPTDVLLKKALVSRLSLPKNEYGYENIVLAAPEGGVLLSVDSAMTHLDPSTISFIREKGHGRDVAVNDFYYCPTHKKIHFDFIAPIKSEKGRTIAILVFRIDPRDYLYPLIQSWPIPSKTAETLILKKDGDGIHFLNDLRHHNNSTLRMRIPLNERSNPGVQAVHGVEGIFEGIDYRGVSVLAYLAPVPNTPWYLVAKVDHNEMLAELYFRAIFITLITFILILLMGATLAFYYRSRQKNIYHSLLVKEKELREYHEEFKTILYSIGDGVITTDLAGRIKQMNQTASILTEWNEDDAKGKSIENVFAIINERTRKTVESPVNRVLSEGAIVGLANHTLLVSKNGKEIPIADSGAPIRNEQGAIEGTVLVFRDKTEEHDAEIKIRKSEEKYKIVADNTYDWEFWINPEGRFIYNSPACKRTTGYNADLFLDDPDLLMRIICEEDRPIVGQHWNKFDLKQLPGKIVFRIVHTDGDLRWIEHICNPVYDANGIFLGTRGSNRDITERKNAENDLRESEEKYRLLHEQAGVGIGYYTPDGKIISYNNQALKNIDMRSEDVVGKFIYDIFPKAAADLYLSRINKALCSDTPLEFEEKANFPIGEVHYLSTFTRICDVQHRPIGVQVMSKDITERKVAEEKLRVNSVAFKTISQGVIITGPDQLILWVNDAFMSITGYSEDEILNRNCRFLQGPLTDRRTVDAMRRALADDMEFSGEILNYRKDGSSFWNELTISPVLDEHSQLTHFIGVIRDITERKHAEAELSRIEARLRQSEKMEAVGQLAGGIAHDFNNVLGGIIGFTDLSLSLVEKNSVLEKNLLKVLKASDRAKNLVKQILTFSRQGNPQRSVISVWQIVKEVLDLLKSSIPSSVVIQVDLEKDVKPVLADPTQIHQALLNLATNAVYAMNRKGTLTVRLYAAIFDKIVHGRSGDIAPGNYTVIEISDTGCGMDENTVAKAFEPFFTTKPVGEGTGMGLSVVLGIVQSHGGDLQIESVLGEGTTIRILLPVSMGSIAGELDDAAYVWLPGPERILFVDDEPMLVDMAENMLTPLGYNFTGMTSSMDALKYLKENDAEIDILVTDQTMPGMTGIELAHEALKIRNDLHIILCTGYSREVNPERVAAIGVKQIVMKPYLANEIGKAIREVLDSKKAG